MARNRRRVPVPALGVARAAETDCPAGVRVLPCMCAVHVTSPALHPARGAAEQNPAAVPPVVTPAAGCPASPTPQAGRVIARSVEPATPSPVSAGSAAGPGSSGGGVVVPVTAPAPAAAGQDDTAAAIAWLEGEAARGPVNGSHYSALWCWRRRQL